MKKFKKAITFSYDDGVTQDIRLIEIFNKYDLKSTFNLNSELLGKPNNLEIKGKPIKHNKVNPEDVKEIYKGHEVAAHTLTHPRLPTLSEEEIIRQVEEDRKNLSELAGYEVIGMAYPCGGENFDHRVSEIIKNNTGIKYSRTIISNYEFDLQESLYEFNPSVYHMEWENFHKIVDEFLALETDKPQILYIWGHSYELDIESDYWERFEELCKKMAGRDDIFYGTNKEVLLSDERYK